MKRRKASDRVQGLLVMLPWLFERKRVRIDEMARTFGLDRDTLVADLTMSTFCGTPPYSPLELIEIYFDDEYVWIEIPRIFTRPLRLTVEEAFTLKAVGEAALAVVGDSTSSALAAALAKLPGVADDAPVVVRQPDDPKLAELADSAASHEIVTIDYFSPISEKSTRRDIVPMRLWVDGDHSYPIVAVDIVNSLRIVRPSGVVLCDDVCLGRSDHSAWVGDETRATLDALERAGLVEVHLVLKKLFPSKNYDLARRRYVAIVRPLASAWQAPVRSEGSAT